MKKFRITKYNPNLRDVNGNYCKNEWTSISDVGRTYDGESFKLADYLKVEDNYLNAILGVLQDLGITEMRVQNLELYAIQSVRVGASKKEGLSLKKALKKLKENMVFGTKELELYFRLQLQELFWCKWVDVHSDAIIEFGYDYYMYITCEKILPERIEYIERNGLFVEEI